MVKLTIHRVHPTGIALGVTAGIIYIVCATLVAAFPDTALMLLGDWFHGVDLASIRRSQLSWGRVIRGFFTFFIFAYLSGVLFAWLYNRCVFHCIKRGWIK